MTMKMMMKSLLLLTLITESASFAPTQNSRTTISTRTISTPHPQKTTSSSSKTSLRLTGEELSVEQITARSNFFIWFFGASGAAGIARSAFPKMYKNTQNIRQLKDEGPTAATGNSGNEMIGISPICGYPRDLATKDVAKIVNNKLTVEQMVKKFPVEGNFLAKKGYLTYEAYKQANKGCNPLAIRAVFDCFAQSTDVVNPDIATRKLGSYRESLNNFKGDLLYSKLVGWASIVTLLGLLGLADIEAYSFAYEGWFPDWPGGRLWLEGGLFDPATGPWQIPKYWI